MIYIYMYWKSSGTMYTMNLRQASSWTCMHADLYMCVDACWQHACAWLKVCMQKAGHPASSIVWIVSAFTCKEIDIHPVYPCMLWTMLYQASCRWRTLFHLGRPSLVTYYSTRLHQLRDISISFRPLVPNLLLPIKKDHLAHIYECRSSNWNCASARLLWHDGRPEGVTKKWKHIYIYILYYIYIKVMNACLQEIMPWPPMTTRAKDKLNPRLHEGPRANWTQSWLRDTLASKMCTHMNDKLDHQTAQITHRQPSSSSSSTSTTTTTTTTTTAATRARCCPTWPANPRRFEPYLASLE